MVNKESKRSRRFVCYCDASSGDKNYCKQGSFILYGRTGGAVYNSIDNWNNNAQCLLVDAHGDRPITKVAGSADEPYGHTIIRYSTNQRAAGSGRLLNGIDRCWLAGRRVSWRRIVRIQNSGISIPLSLLKLLGLRRILIASFTLRVYQCRSWERH